MWFATKRHIEDLKEAHEARVKELMRTIDVLSEQVEWLRLQLGRPNLTTTPALNPSELPTRLFDESGHVSEEEEDLQFLVGKGRMTELEMEEILARQGLRNTQVHIDVPS